MTDSHQSSSGDENPPLEPTVRRVVIARRMVVRRSAPTPGWWPWGVLYIAALVLLFAYAFLFFAPWVIEAQVAREVRSRLEGAEVNKVAVTADGQRVRIQGEFTGERTEEGLIALAETTRCSTLVFGKLICPTYVEAELTREVPLIEPAPAPLMRSHDFVIAWSGERLGLRGEAPDSGTRRAIVERAREAFPFSQLSDELDVTGDRAQPEYPAAFTRALEVLGYLEDGSAEWQNRRLNVYGSVRTDTASAAEDAFYRTEGAPPLGSLVLSSIEQINRCDAEFEEVLASSTIYFRTGKADISRRSQEVLARLVTIAADCSGDLIVEGHADISGTRAFNQQLSLKRARAVVLALSDMGINPARLHPRGLGVDHPAADNTTSGGRALNRRIEVRIQRTEL